jgi:hypothetical protein
MEKADAAVLAQIQGLFRDTESFVIAAFQVQHHTSSILSSTSSLRE